MNAVLDVIMDSKYYSVEKFGTRSFMLAQWIAHNLCYDIASIGEVGKALMQFLGGSGDPLASSSSLDIRCNDNMLKRQRIVYNAIASFYG